MGQIGSAFGGFMGPVVTAISFYYLFQALKVSRETLEKEEINKVILSHKTYLDDKLKKDFKRLKKIKKKIDDLISSNNNPNINIPTLLPDQSFDDLIGILRKFEKILCDGVKFENTYEYFLFDVIIALNRLKCVDTLDGIVGSLNIYIESTILQNPEVELTQKLANSIKEKINRQSINF
jgi:hypothetical protein